MKNFFVNPPIFFLIMNIGELLYQCNAEAKLIFRKYEKINKKIIETNWSKTFNEVCLKEDLWPSYTNYHILKTKNTREIV